MRDFSISASVVLLATSGVAACGYNVRSMEDVDPCKEADRYEILETASFEGEHRASASFGDPSEGASRREEILEIPKTETTPSCLGDRALVLASRGYNWYGSGLFFRIDNDWNGGADATGFDGIALWARVTEDSQRIVPVKLKNWQTKGGRNPDDIYADPLCYKKPKDKDGDGVMDEGPDLNKDGVIDEKLPPGLECKSQWLINARFSTEWSLVRLPFSQFRQEDPQEGKAFESLSLNGIEEIEFRLPGTHDLEIWIDSVGFYRPATFLPALDVPNRTPGLQYRQYSGFWDNLPDFASLPGGGSGTTPTFDISVAGLNGAFGLSFSGYIKVPERGSYSFYLKSDDGSRLLIHDRTVVNHDGVHSIEIEQRGKVSLEAGLHPIRVDYFQKADDMGLEIGYSGPGIEKQPIPADVLFH